MNCNNTFNSCPMCGGKNIGFVDNKKWFCSDCAFTLYHNVAAAVCVIVADREGNVLLEKRAKEPRKGFFALPGGFIDPDESADEAALRECREEAALEIRRVQYLCSFPNTYEYKRILYKTCDVFYRASLPRGIETIDALIKNLRAQKSEVESFTAVRITNDAELAAVPLAFENSRRALGVWLKRRRR